jgi:hypothetical protein
MRFQLIDAAKEAFPVQRMCDVLGVSSSGYFALYGDFLVKVFFSWRHPFSSTRRSSSSSEGSPLCARQAPATLYSVEPCMARTMKQSFASAARLRGGGPILATA